MEADGTVDAQNAPTAPWKTLRVFHELPQGLSHRITHAKPRKAPKWRWETRIDPISVELHRHWRVTLHGHQMRLKEARAELLCARMLANEAAFIFGMQRTRSSDNQTFL